MLNGKYISVKHAIERVFSDYGTAFASSINFDDVIEWAWEALALIGAPHALVENITNGVDGPAPIEIEGYRGILPDELYSITMVRDYETKRPMVCIDNPFMSLDSGQSSSSYQLPLLSGTTSYDSDGNIVRKDSALISGYNGEIKQSMPPFSYKINGNYIFTSKEEMQLEVAYRAFMTDGEGLPMIPDNTKYINAVRDRIAERLAFRAYMNDEITERKYEKINQEWLWYVGAAKTAAQMPSIDKLEAIKNRFLQLRENPNHHDTSFVYAAEQGKLLIHNNSSRR